MTDEGKDSIESKTNRETIEQVEATEHAPRGNVHSEVEKDDPKMDLVPPMPA